MRSSTEEASNETGDAYDTGDRLSVKEKEKLAKVREERRIDGLRQLMKTPNGRLWMWRFLESCGLFSVIFNGNSKDYFNLGQRNAGMPIFSDLQKHCLDDYIQMTKENSNVQ